MQQYSCVDTVEVPDQPTDEILLIDPHNRGYEDLPDDETDEINEDEFYENNEQWIDEN